ncbi:coiled-coil domain-containing protein 146 isoform X1 [Oryzias melastigma]|uniref:coiled-coil domain-containing protein 146 isoform X1 n=1 Tax=Oryzias melastigma TaxID=30732 RepID=UPI000CF7BC4E|nr:coiled-coil domain-containing protein 146 isoform X1 [Oryzias melastigma]
MEEQENTSPPHPSLQEDQQSVNVAVSACPAFQYLEEMFTEGKINQATVSKLKASYKLLHDKWKRSQESEIKLLSEAKRCRAELERLQVEVESAEEQSNVEEPDSEVSALRGQLLGAYNTLHAAEEREHKTQHELQWLREEKKHLEAEIQKKPAESNIDTEDLNDKYEELMEEVALRQQEIRNLTKDLEAHEIAKLEEQKELEEKKQAIELKEAEKAQLLSRPDQIFKEAERKRSKLEEAAVKMEALNVEFSEMEQRASALNEGNRSLRTTREDLKELLEGLKAKVEASQGEQRQLLKKRELLQEEVAELTGNRGVLEMKLRSLMSEKKQVYESRSVQLTESNRQIQALKRMEQALTVATEQLAFKTSVCNELQAQLDAVPQREATTKQGMELQKEVEALKDYLKTQQLSLSEVESQKKQQFEIIQELQKESMRLRQELHQLRCQILVKAEQKGREHRELLRAKQLREQIQQELREKDLIIEEHKKVYTNLHHRILEYSNLCAISTEERQRYFNLKKSVTNAAQDLTVHEKLLENQLSSQCGLLVNINRAIHQTNMKASATNNDRMKLRDSLTKLARKQRHISQECEENQLELMNLRELIKLQEETLSEINKNHETARRRRDFLANQLLEQQDVVSDYTRHIKSQVVAIGRSNEALETVEKHIKKLQQEIDEKKRHIDLKNKEIHLKKQLEEEITMLQIELSEASDRTLESVNRAADFKELKSKVPSSVELLKKVEQLEGNLAERERQLLEKELLVEQVTRLTKPLGEQAENYRQDSLSLAKRLNEVRTLLIDTNQRIMAVSAELSVKQADALWEKQQIKEKEVQMERCQRRLEQGLSPHPEIEEEWRRTLRDKRRRQKDKEEKERLAEEDKWKPLPSGKRTTADIRPNAYIPENDLLPLPKPYGAMAPFKPSQPGANMRHFAKL